MTDIQQQKPSTALQSVLDEHRLWIKTKGAGAQLTDERAGWRFEGLDLNGVCFRRAKLESAEFIRCSLVGADFYMADLSGTLFKGCDLTDAAFDEANLDGCAFVDDLTHGATFKNASVRLANIPSVTPPLTTRDFDL